MEDIPEKVGPELGELMYSESGSYLTREGATISFHFVSFGSCWCSSHNFEPFDVLLSDMVLDNNHPST